MANYRFQPLQVVIGWKRRRYSIERRWFLFVFRRYLLSTCNRFEVTCVVLMVGNGEMPISADRGVLARRWGHQPIPWPRFCLDRPLKFFACLCLVRKLCDIPDFFIFHWKVHWKSWEDGRSRMTRTRDQSSTFQVARSIYALKIGCLNIEQKHLKLNLLITINYKNKQNYIQQYEWWTDKSSSQALKRHL